MKQVYPLLKWSQPLSFPLADCSFPRSGLSDLAMLGLTTVRSRKRKVLSRKRKLVLELFYIRYTFSGPTEHLLKFLNRGLFVYGRQTVILMAIIGERIVSSCNFYVLGMNKQQSLA